MHNIHILQFICALLQFSADIFPPNFLQQDPLLSVCSASKKNIVGTLPGSQYLGHNDPGVLRLQRREQAVLRDRVDRHELLHVGEVFAVEDEEVQQEVPEVRLVLAVALGVPQPHR